VPGNTEKKMGKKREKVLLQKKTSFLAKYEKTGRKGKRTPPEEGKPKPNKTRLKGRGRLKYHSEGGKHGWSLRGGVGKLRKKNLHAGHS